MSRRDVVIAKLSATMDPDNARALLDEVVRESDTRQILDDHMHALEFLRELTSAACEWGCTSHPEEQPCIRCRAEKWLHTEAK